MSNYIKNFKTSPITNRHGDLEWYNDKGQIHRENGPAIIFSFDCKAWYLNGKQHRTDGPSILDEMDGNCYRILGDGLRKIEFNNWILRVLALYKINYTIDSFYDDFEEVLYSL